MTSPMTPQINRLLEEDRPLSTAERARLMESAELADEAHRMLLAEMKRMQGFDRWSYYGTMALTWLCGFGFALFWRTM